MQPDILTAADGAFLGFKDSECGEHRTVGEHRAWCFDCTEWCYPESPCRGCELPALRVELENTRQALRGYVEWAEYMGYGDTPAARDARALLGEVS